MNSHIKETRRLADLESFDTAAFEADDAVSQDVCNFVLTLALIYNDLNDLFYAHMLLQSRRPKGEFKVTRNWGEYNGVRIHLLRLIIGLIHELGEFIKRNEKVFEDSYFQSVVKQLSAKERKIWEDFVGSIIKKEAKTSVDRFTLFIRNKVAFHYDPKGIHSGYHTLFTSGLHGTERAYISRGGSMAETRYYFADAATDGYLRKDVDGEGGDQLIVEASKIIKDLSIVFMDLIHHFIQKRGFIYSKEKDET